MQILPPSFAGRNGMRRALCLVFVLLGLWLCFFAGIGADRGSLGGKMRTVKVRGLPGPKIRIWGTRSFWGGRIWATCHPAQVRVATCRLCPSNRPSPLEEYLLCSDFYSALIFP